jgi:hypothetical protein
MGSASSKPPHLDHHNSSGGMGPRSTAPNTMATFQNNARAGPGPSSAARAPRTAVVQPSSVPKEEGEISSGEDDIQYLGPPTPPRRPPTPPRPRSTHTSPTVKNFPTRSAASSLPSGPARVGGRTPKRRPQSSVPQARAPPPHLPPDPEPEVKVTVERSNAARVTDSPGPLAPAPAGK